jgi:hypothetical protein
MLDRNKRYTVKRHGGVAFYFAGYPQVAEIAVDDETGWEYETGEWVDDDSGMVLMVMVGDDYKWTVDESDCTEIAEDSYCRDCGQIGCTSNTITE